MLAAGVLDRVLIGLRVLRPVAALGKVCFAEFPLFVFVCEALGEAALVALGRGLHI